MILIARDNEITVQKKLKIEILCVALREPVAIKSMVFK
jgi:hypothetical protein